MEAKELFFADGKPASVWYCSKCNIVKRTEAEAEGCCAPRKCNSCGILFDKKDWALSACKRCWECTKEAKKREQIDKALEVDPSESAMFMVEEFCGHDDGWFQSIDEIIDYGCAGDGECLPEFAFCSNPEQRQIDIGDVLERVCEDGYEDMGENFLGVEDLQTAIDRFNELNKDRLKVYNVDYTRKVRIPWPAQNS